MLGFQNRDVRVWSCRGLEDHRRGQSLGCWCRVQQWLLSRSSFMAGVLAKAEFSLGKNKKGGL